MKRKFSLALAVLACAAVALTGCGETDRPPDNGQQTEERTMTNHSVYPEGVAYDDSIWQTPESYAEEALDRSEADIRAVWLRSDYKGAESYAFCYLGVPQGAAADNKKPAVLLLHGGGGTAYWEWVKLWTDRGYVALAVDLEGHVPTTEGALTSAPADLYTKSPYAAPNNVNYADAGRSLEETWMHYATRTAILGNSYLHSLDLVDVYKVGVCGVSWGGLITSIITGYDDRFAFSVPIYCTVNAAATDTEMGNYYRAHPEALVWDTDAALQKIGTPMCFVASNIDRFGRIDQVSMTKQRVKNSRLVLLKDFQHSQYHACSLTEPLDFADAVVKDRKQIFPRTQPTAASPEFTLEIPAGCEVKRAFLVYTTETLRVGASFARKKVAVSVGTVSFTVPEGATAYFVNVEDAYGATVTTDLVQL